MELDPRLAADGPDSLYQGQEQQRQQQQEEDGHDQEHADAVDDEHDNEGQTARKSRACEACRGLKVRCQPDANEGPCQRCRKAGRRCVVTEPTRKRQKKTDSRVTELEKKIDALTASLQARAGQPSSSSLPSWSSSAAAGQKRKAGPPGDVGDIVDRGLITMDQAASLLDRYRDRMVQHLPAVIVPASTSAADLRRSKPTLFLAVMAAATGETTPLQRALSGELMRVLADKVFLAGEKSVELVQALHVAVIWYWPPEHFEELKFYQLIHTAAVMAIDIGLGRRQSPGGARGVTSPGLQRRQPPDPTSLECRRTWLTCFFLALNTSMSLRRPNLIRWSRFMAESLDVLASSPDAAPTDRYLCHLVWTHRLGDEIGARFDPDATPVDLADARVQYTLRALERELHNYMAAVPQTLMQPTLRISFSVVNLYMHEMALHSDAGEWRAPFAPGDDPRSSSSELSMPHVSALAACLAAIDGIFDAFLAMDVPSIRCLPVFNFMRVAYAVVILIKMYFSASKKPSPIPSSPHDLGCLVDRDAMRVEHRLAALIDKFRAAAADDLCRPAAKFLVVLVMLRSWFFKQGARQPREQPPDDSVRLPDNHNSGHRVVHGMPPQPPPFLPTLSAGVTPPVTHHQGLHLRDLNPAQTPASDLDQPLVSSFSPPAPSSGPWLGANVSASDLDLGPLPTFDSMGIQPSDGIDLLDGSVNIFFNDPLFSATIQGLPDQTLFPFQY